MWAWNWVWYGEDELKLNLDNWSMILNEWFLIQSVYLIIQWFFVFVYQKYMFWGFEYQIWTSIAILEFQNLRCSLERGKSRSSMKIELPVVFQILQSVRATKVALERRPVFSIFWKITFSSHFNSHLFPRHSRHDLWLNKD